MLLYELYKPNIRKYGSVEKLIELELYIERDDEFVKNAFNRGRGTKQSMNEYMRDNRNFCVWIDAETMEQVTRI